MASGATTASEATSKHSEDICKAYTIAHEAENQGMRGKRAVLDVIENRERIRGLSACGVIREKAQFSFYKANLKMKVSKEQLQDYRNTDMMQPVLDECAEYFHALHSHPKWHRMKLVAVIKQHRFYCKI
jgi:spore germination cell wall hydrolase CwlJ-like protein